MDLSIQSNRNNNPSSASFLNASIGSPKLQNLQINPSECSSRLDVYPNPCGIPKQLDFSRVETVVPMEVNDICVGTDLTSVKTKGPCQQLMPYNHSIISNAITSGLNSIPVIPHLVSVLNSLPVIKNQLTEDHAEINSYSLPINNEDSLDSNTSNNRRKRKPNKTIHIVNGIDSIEKTEYPLVTTSELFDKSSVDVKKPYNNTAEDKPENLSNYNSKTVKELIVTETAEKDNVTTEEVRTNVKTEVTTENSNSCIKNSFEEVENKLEEMFAGIDDKPIKIPATDDTKIDIGIELNSSAATQMQFNKIEIDSNALNNELNGIKPIANKLPQKKKINNSRKRIANAKKKKEKSKFSFDHGPLENFCKSKFQKEKPIKDDSVLFPDTRYKGPCIQVKDDGSLTVINSPIIEEDLDKQNKTKKTLLVNSERNRIRGMHVSTLSNKYDADTTDTTWICAFCKIGPHKMILGDLFGPYIVSTACDDFNLSQSRLINNPNRNAVPTDSKKVQTLTDLEMKENFFGMVKVSDTSYEIWVHEDCIVWSSGVYLIGAKIIGLEAAVWSSFSQFCKICSKNGAMICCSKRGCGLIAHIPCAKLDNWKLNEEQFQTYCQQHSN